MEQSIFFFNIVRSGVWLFFYRDQSFMAKYLSTFNLELPFLTMTCFKVYVTHKRKILIFCARSTLLCSFLMDGRYWPRAATNSYGRQNNYKQCSNEPLRHFSGFRRTEMKPIWFESLFRQCPHQCEHGAPSHGAGAAVWTIYVFEAPCQGTFFQFLYLQFQFNLQWASVEYNTVRSVISICHEMKLRTRQRVINRSNVGNTRDDEILGTKSLHPYTGCSCELCARIFNYFESWAHCNLWDAAQHDICRASAQVTLPQVWFSARVWILSPRAQSFYALRTKTFWKDVDRQACSRAFGFFFFTSILLSYTEYFFRTQRLNTYYLIDCSHLFSLMAPFWGENIRFCFQSFSFPRMSQEQEEVNSYFFPVFGYSCNINQIFHFISLI